MARVEGKPFTTGTVRGVIVEFPNKGDILLMHTHGPEDVHITIAIGPFEVRGKTFESFVIETGRILDWEPGVWHEFESLAPKGRLVNIIKG